MYHYLNKLLIYYYIMKNINNENNENIFFSIDENSNQNIISEEIINFSGLLDDFNLNDVDNYNLINYNSYDKGMNEIMYFDYKINYTVKDLLLICEYYGISKEMKTNKCNKEEIIVVLVGFENNPENKDIVLRRQSMWYCINKLKNDKFMKKYVLW